MRVRNVIIKKRNVRSTVLEMNHKWTTVYLHVRYKQNKLRFEVTSVYKFNGLTIKKKIIDTYTCINVLIRKSID